MKLYKDAQLKQEIQELDLGMVMAGEKQSYEFYLYNETNAFVDNIALTLTHNEVELVSYPKTLKSKESAKIEIKWSPSITIKEGLKTLLKIKASEIYS